MSRLFAIAIPIPAHKQQQWNEFVRELKDHRFEEFQAIRRKLGVRERTFFQQTAMGGMVIITLEGEDPEAAFAQIAKGQDEFTKWFVQKVKDVHEVDLTAPPPGPMPYLTMDSGPVMISSTRLA